MSHITLMHKNDKVADAQILGTVILNYQKVYIPELLPVGTNAPDKLLEPQLLRHWSEGRCVPNGRPMNSEVFSALGMGRSEALLKSMGLSLTDRYWFQTEETKDMTWEDINFHDNGFEPVFAQALEGNPLFLPSPDFVTDGMMDKFWYTSHGLPLLAKFDSKYCGVLMANELVYGDIAYSLGINTTDYHYARFGDKTACTCPCFVKDANEEYINAMQLKHAALSKRVGKNLLDYISAELSFSKEIAQMCLLDAVLHNTDRHERNFGIIREDSGKTRFVPLFDNGCCLGYNRQKGTPVSDGDMRIFSVMREDILRGYLPDADMEISNRKAHLILKQDYEMFEIPEERYEVAKEELDAGLQLLERVKGEITYDR